MKIKNIIQESISVKQKVLENETIINTIQEVTDEIVACFKKDGQLLFCGNGGSAADAQHLAAEFSGRFYFDRDPLNSEALHVNTSYLTAVGNDYSYQEVYARIIKAKGRTGDVLVGISTSGNSGNVVKALAQAKKQGMITVGLTGETGGEMKALCDFIIPIPSTDTPRIQECHITVGHIICELVEEALFTKGK
ncbi:D-sedoheptulose 7-phosphate isomerase [Flavobacteriales bacterium]|jgi:D-sedoheptulose 7-phosphate isomerase|nr:D-sedoheptulose 7-phosphate isomerase [Flavobacteriales bacterium]MDC0015042.1 D-sedoheptulose 7-phosphate isomerase [Flavobacteriales bacterium]MDG1174833.1 D-sedoheptulose 7-phosphate isomerase [Flavobacteriales bacterium]|tara:strand:+ start:2849 stop:3427 length:579 start_codon:yes stop_codon:yes gene_type:complete